MIISYPSKYSVSFYTHFSVKAVRQLNTETMGKGLPGFTVFFIGPRPALTKNFLFTLTV